jgi:hypothetical protein
MAIVDVACVARALNLRVRRAQYYKMTEGSWNLVESGVAECVSAATGTFGWLRGTATRRRHSLMLPYRFELIGEFAA